VSIYFLPESVTLSEKGTENAKALCLPCVWPVAFLSPGFLCVLCVLCGKKSLLMAMTTFRQVIMQLLVPDTNEFTEKMHHHRGHGGREGFM